MAEFDREATVRELDRIDALYSKMLDLKDNLDSIKEKEENETKAQANVFIKELNRFEEKANESFGTKTPDVSGVCKNGAPPVKPSINNAELSVFFGALSGVVCFGLFTLFLLLCIIANGFASKISWVFSLLIIVSGLFWFILNKPVGEYLDWIKSKSRWDKKMSTINDQTEQERFLKECSDYEKRFVEVVGVCSKEYDKKQAQYEKIVDETHEKYSSEYGTVLNELEPVLTQLNEVSLIQPDLFNKAAVLSDLLRTQRADSLKEAINLAIEEERREREEEERREEARRQEAILEQQAEDARRHQQKIEEHNREMEMYEKMIYRETVRQGEEAERYRREEERHRKESDRRLNEATERYKYAARRKSFNVNPESAKQYQREMDESLADILANKR